MNSQSSNLTPFNRVVEASLEIQEAQATRTDFMHSVLCQVGMPRKPTPGTFFERTSGYASVMIESGKLWTGTTWEQLPLPYGPCPRLVIVHISTEAIRTRSKDIEIGHSIREFLQKLGIQTTGGTRGGYTTFKKQMRALAACQLTLGFVNDSRPMTVKAPPISKFEAWLPTDGAQLAMWPGELALSQEFYDTLIDHAVPLDWRALAALKHSALALDIYTWLAHRLHRISHQRELKLTWWNLLAQFGQEYSELKNFKKRFNIAMRQALSVYPDAKVEKVRGGFIFRASPPPIPKSQVVVMLPEKAN